MGGVVQTIRGSAVTSAFFPAAKTLPLFGRLFLPEEYQSGRGRVALLCNTFWKQQLNEDPAWLGRTLQLNDQDFTIVGVMPATFEVPSGVDIWVPDVGPSN